VILIPQKAHQILCAAIFAGGGAAFSPEKNKNSGNIWKSVKVFGTYNKQRFGKVMEV
jgi:hypothetical protein